ncbi:hypothetical protein ASD03_22530 [Ensifer sp. Root127]|nr:hypothetical protein ASD03_22530 [Ensifer sp. Root127]
MRIETTGGFRVTKEVEFLAGRGVGMGRKLFEALGDRVGGVCGLDAEPVQSVLRGISLRDEEGTARLKGHGQRDTPHLPELEIAVGKIQRRFRRKADAKTGRGLSTNTL